MSVAQDVVRSAKVIGGPQPLKGSRRYEILAKDFTQGEQAYPIPIVFGREKIAGTHVTPVWGFQATAVTTKAGK